MNLNNKVAVVYEDGLATEVHRFTLPTYTEPRFYQSVTSYNGMRNREHGRYVKWLKSRNSKLGKPMKLMLRITAEVDVPWNLENEWKRLTCFHHASIFDFYAIVGYDYKKRSWAPRSKLPSLAPPQPVFPQPDLASLIKHLKVRSRFIAEYPDGRISSFKVRRRRGKSFECQIINGAHSATFDADGYCASYNARIVYVRTGPECPYTGNDYDTGLVLFQERHLTAVSK
jgi:hypothetical protein